MAQLAERWGELNVVHSFREGNTRSQFVFFSQLAEQAGYRIDSKQFAPDERLRGGFVQARFHSQDTGDNDRLAVVLSQAITPVKKPLQPQETLRASFPHPVAEAARFTGTARGQRTNTGARRRGQSKSTQGPEYE